jgi:D-3-phosphoglycerate dehydrogenase / 2-oxoglutarate reductase
MLKNKQFIMRVLIADKFEQSGRDGLKLIGCEIDYQPDLKETYLLEAIKQTRPDVLIVRSTKVTAEMLETNSLQLVVRAGAGFNNIDVAAASKRGIYVANCPGKNSIAVAELAFALILALDRRIVDNVLSLRRGEWNKKEYSKAKGLMGSTLGLIGVGNIAQELIVRARAFGMKIVAWSRSLDPEKAARLEVEYKESAFEVALVSDIISVHLALNEHTRSFINKDFFNAMREGALFINTSRGEVVDQSALIWAIQEKGIRAGLDVFAKEPTSSVDEFKDEIVKEANLYGTHHIGASTDQAQEAIAAETVHIIRTFKETGKVPNVLNLARYTPATHVLVVRHMDRPGVLASVLNALKEEQINVQEMENIIFEGAEAAVARIHLDNLPNEELLARLKSSDTYILDLTLLPLN